jgi:hypothetical protein
MEPLASVGNSHGNDAEEIESNSASSLSLTTPELRSLSTQTHSVVCWDDRCSACPAAPIARITPWPRATPTTTTTSSAEEAAASTLARWREAFVAPAARRQATRDSPIPPLRRLSSFQPATSTSVELRRQPPPPPPLRSPFTFPSPSAPTVSPRSLQEFNDVQDRARVCLLTAINESIGILSDLVLKTSLPQWERWFVGDLREKAQLIRGVNLYQRAKAEAKVLREYGFYSDEDLTEIAAKVRLAEDYLVNLELGDKVVRRRPYGQWEPTNEQLALRGVRLWGADAVAVYEERRRRGEFPLDDRSRR